MCVCTVRSSGTSARTRSSSRSTTSCASLERQLARQLHVQRQLVAVGQPASRARCGPRAPRARVSAAAVARSRRSPSASRGSTWTTHVGAAERALAPPPRCSSAAVCAWPHARVRAARRRRGRRSGGRPRGARARGAARRARRACASAARMRSLGLGRRRGPSARRSTAAASRSAAMITSTATNSAGDRVRAVARRRATSIRPTSTASEPARSEAKCSALAASAARAVRRDGAQAGDRARGVDDDHDDEHGERPPGRVHVVAAVAADQAVDRLVRDEQRDEHQERALAERREVLGLAVAVVVLAVGRADRDAHREQGEQRGDEVGAGVGRLGDEGERAGDEAGDELDRDEEDGGGDAQPRRCARARARRRSRSPAPLRRRLPSPPNSDRSGLARALGLLGLEQPDDQRAGGAAAVADRVLLLGVELGHRAARRRGSRRARRPGRSRSRRRRAARWRACPRSGRATTSSRAARLDVGERAHVRHAAVAVGGHLAQQLGEVLLVGGVLAGVARRPDAGRAAERGRLDARVVGDRGRARSPPPRRAPCRARSRRRSCPSRAAARTSSGSGSSSYGRISSDSSRSLCSLRVARTSRTAQPAAAAATASSWAVRSALDPVGGEGEQLVERGARERRALGGGLHLDEAAVAGHHHVRVDLGASSPRSSRGRAARGRRRCPHETAATELCQRQRRRACPRPSARRSASSSAT